MRTTLDIDPKLVDEVTKLNGEGNKGRAVNKAQRSTYAVAGLMRCVAR